jgi:hypothetical protein
MKNAKKENFLLWTRIVASRIDAYMPGQEAANHRQYPGKLGAAYY